MRQLIVGAMLLAVPGNAVADTAQLAAIDTEGFGSILADARGHPLYVFTLDQGRDASTCHGKCAAAWPPLVTQDDPQPGSEIDRGLLGTIRRDGGEQQVTYGGWPLYRFEMDQRPGTVSGQGARSFGGEWYLISVDGEVIRDDQRATAPPSAQ